MFPVRKYGPKNNMFQMGFNFEKIARWQRNYCLGEIIELPETINPGPSWACLDGREAVKYQADYPEFFSIFGHGLWKIYNQSIYTYPPTTYIYLLTMAANEDIMLAFSSSSSTTYFTSTDGVVWIQRNLPSAMNISYGVVWTGTKFVIVGYGSSKCMTSSDGINWNTYSMPASVNWRALAYSPTLNRLVAFPYNTATEGAYSDDQGETWTAFTLPSASPWMQVVWAGDKFFAMMNSTTSSNIYYSVDGISDWTLGSGFGNIAVANSHYNSILGLSFIFSTNSQIYYSSSNGISWTSRSLSTTIGTPYIPIMNPVTGTYFVLASAYPVFVHSLTGLPSWSKQYSVTEGGSIGYYPTVFKGKFYIPGISVVKHGWFMDPSTQFQIPYKLSNIPGYKCWMKVR